MSPLARHWPWAALLASLALLGVAHAFEAFGHMLPCELCLKQRLVYWIAAGIAAAGLAWRFAGRGADLTRWVNLLLFVAFGAELAVAVYHAGVEWKFWPGPAVCTGGSTHVDPAALERLLSGARMGVVACDKPAWVFLGISMAGWNAVAAAGLTVASAVAFPRSRRPA